ncbi:MAG: hypothetical protein R3B46_01700 [Phycisphaerales bacterium]
MTIDQQVEARWTASRVDLANLDAGRIEGARLENVDRLMIDLERVRRGADDGD